MRNSILALIMLLVGTASMNAQIRIQADRGENNRLNCPKVCTTTTHWSWTIGFYEVKICVEDCGEAIVLPEVEEMEEKEYAYAGMFPMTLTTFMAQDCPQPRDDTMQMPCDPEIPDDPNCDCYVFPPLIVFCDCDEN